MNLNPAALLALIAELYAENTALRQELASQSQNAEPSPKEGST